MEKGAQQEITPAASAAYTNAQHDHPEGSIMVLFVAGRGDQQVKLQLAETDSAGQTVEILGKQIHFKVAGGLAYGNDQCLFADKDTWLSGETDPEKVAPDDIAMRAVPILPKLPRRARRDGKTCADCLIFDPVLGRQEYEQITHIYENGVLEMTKEIVAKMSEVYGRRGLDSDNVGYCAKRQSLCSRTSPACEDLEEEQAPAAAPAPSPPKGEEGAPVAAPTPAPEVAPAPAPTTPGDCSVCAGITTEGQRCPRCGRMYRNGQMTYE